MKFDVSTKYHDDKKEKHQSHEVIISLTLELDNHDPDICMYCEPIEITVYGSSRNEVFSRAFNWVSGQVELGFDHTTVFNIRESIGACMKQHLTDTERELIGDNIDPFFRLVTSNPDAEDPLQTTGTSNIEKAIGRSFLSLTPKPRKGNQSEMLMQYAERREQYKKLWDMILRQPEAYTEKFRCSVLISAMLLRSLPTTVTRQISDFGAISEFGQSSLNRQVDGHYIRALVNKVYYNPNGGARGRSLTCKTDWMRVPFNTRNMMDPHTFEWVRHHVYSK